MKLLIGLLAAAGLLYLGLVWIRPPVAPDVPLPRLFAGSEPPAPAASAGGDRLEVLVGGHPARLSPSWPVSPDPLPGLWSATDGD